MTYNQKVKSSALLTLDHKIECYGESEAINQTSKLYPSVDISKLLNHLHYIKNTETKNPWLSKQKHCY